MLRYIILFVLVMTMVKTNAQNSLLSSQSTDELLVRLTLTATQQDVASMLAKVANDPDFSTTSDGTGGYFILDKDPQSTITSQQAISNYLNESYVGSASFLYYDGDGKFHGTTYDVIVRGKPNVTAGQISTAATNLGMLQMSDLIPELNMYLLYFDKNVDVFDVSDDLAQTGLVEYAEPNLLSEYTPNYIGDYTTSGSGDCFVMRQPTTNDPYINNFYQWNLYTGYTHEFSTIINPPAPNNAEQFSDINVCNAWNFANGSAKLPSAPKAVSGYSQLLGRPIYVAVLDDGIDTRHEDLNIRKKSNGVSAYGFDAVEFTHPNASTPASNPIYSPNLPNDEGCPDLGLFPSTQHGTMVAGVIAAKRNNLLNSQYLGMGGVAYEAELMPVKIAWKLSQTTNAKPAFDAASIISGIRWAVNNGADVLNCSFTVGATSQQSGLYIPGSKSREDAIAYATTYGRSQTSGQPGRGCVIVWSAGNGNHQNIDWPSSNPDVISVGAMSMCHERKHLGSCDKENWGSNYGVGLTQYHDAASTQALNTNNKLSVVAPGVHVVSSQHANGGTPSAGHHTNGAIVDLFNGTSAAAPHVAGVAALVLSVNPCLTYKEVKDIIELGAEKIQPNIPPPNSYTYNYSMSDNGYYANEVGYGKVNAGNAVALAHDLYKQDMTETGSEVYHASHYIFAGANVTNILPVINWINPDYIISPGADIKFYVRNGQGIVLTPGFRAEYGSGFLADPDVNISCDNSHHHYKPGKKDKNEINPSGKQPILSSSDNLLHDIKVYPNPAKETINIEFMLEGDADVSFTMLNMLGQKMKETETTGLAKGMQKQQMSLQGLTPGVYFVGIKTPAGYNQFRFIKE